MYPSGIIEEYQKPFAYDGERKGKRSVVGDSQVLIVNNHHVDASDDHDGQDPEHPLATIQAAVNKANGFSGDVIYVMGNDGWQYGGGTSAAYVESVVVPATKPGIEIIGVGRGSMGVNWTPGAAGEACLTILAIDVTVRNFNFDAPLGGDGISLLWDGAITFGENTTIENCTFTDRIDKGVIIEYSWYVKILNCLFDSCDEHGIYSDPAGSGVAFALIEGNRFHDCAVAIEFDIADDCVIRGNSFYNGTAQGAGVATDQGINTANGSDNLIIGNYFSCLLPVPANGDWDDLNSGAATDAWVGNYLMDGIAVTTPT